MERGVVSGGWMGGREWSGVVAIRIIIDGWVGAGNRWRFLKAALSFGVFKIGKDTREGKRGWMGMGLGRWTY